MKTISLSRAGTRIFSVRSRFASFACATLLTSCIAKNDLGVDYEPGDGGSVKIICVENGQRRTVQNEEDCTGKDAGADSGVHAQDARLPTQDSTSDTGHAVDTGHLAPDTGRPTLDARLEDAGVLDSAVDAQPDAAVHVSARCSQNLASFVRVLGRGMEPIILQDNEPREVEIEGEPYSFRAVPSLSSDFGIKQVSLEVVDSQGNRTFGILNEGEALEVGNLQLQVGLTLANNESMRPFAGFELVDLSNDMRRHVAYATDFPNSDTVIALNENARIEISVSYALISPTFATNEAGMQIISIINGEEQRVLQGAVHIGEDIPLVLNGVSMALNLMDISLPMSTAEGIESGCLYLPRAIFGLVDNNNNLISSVDYHLGQEDVELGPFTVFPGTLVFTGSTFGLSFVDGSLIDSQAQRSIQFQLGRISGEGLGNPYAEVGNGLRIELQGVTTPEEHESQ